MTSKLYKAVDGLDGTVSCFLVNERGVAISHWQSTDDEEIKMNMDGESLFPLAPIEAFTERAIDPVLIAEW